MTLVGLLTVGRGNAQTPKGLRNLWGLAEGNQATFRSTEADCLVRTPAK